MRSPRRPYQTVHFKTTWLLVCAVRLLNYSLRFFFENTALKVRLLRKMNPESPCASAQTTRPSLP
jgi:hypothetical protein